MTPAPTVYTYVTIVEPNGAERILKYVILGTDHHKAALEAVDRLRTLDVRRIETFDGEPGEWTAKMVVEELA